MGFHVVEHENSKYYDESTSEAQEDDSYMFNTDDSSKAYEKVSSVDEFGKIHYSYEETGETLGDVRGGLTLVSL